jgi:hypothetical protein
MLAGSRRSVSGMRPGGPDQLGSGELGPFPVRSGLVAGGLGEQPQEAGPAATPGDPVAQRLAIDEPVEVPVRRASSSTMARRVESPSSPTPDELLCSGQVIK